MLLQWENCTSKGERVGGCDSSTSKSQSCRNSRPAKVGRAGDSVCSVVDLAHSVPFFCRPLEDFPAQAVFRSTKKLSTPSALSLISFRTSLIQARAILKIGGNIPPKFFSWSYRAIKRSKPYFSPIQTSPRHAPLAARSRSLALRAATLSNWGPSLFASQRTPRRKRRRGRASRADDTLMS